MAIDKASAPARSAGSAVAAAASASIRTMRDALRSLESVSSTSTPSGPQNRAALRRIRGSRSPSARRAASAASSLEGKRRERSVGSFERDRRIQHRPHHVVDSLRRYGGIPDHTAPRHRHAGELLLRGDPARARSSVEERLAGERPSIDREHRIEFGVSGAVAFSVLTRILPGADLDLLAHAFHQERGPRSHPRDADVEPVDVGVPKTRDRHDREASVTPERVGEPANGGGAALGQTDEEEHGRERENPDAGPEVEKQAGDGEKEPDGDRDGEQEGEREEKPSRGAQGGRGGSTERVRHPIRFYACGAANADAARCGTAAPRKSPPSPSLPPSRTRIFRATSAPCNAPAAPRSSHCPSRR